MSVIELDAVVGDLAHGRDELERGARVVADGARRARRTRRVGPSRDGTGLPSPSVCASPSDDEKPSAPAANDSCSEPHHRRDLLVRSRGRAWRRRPSRRGACVEWPTRKPALTASRPSRRSSHSPKARQSHARPASSDVERHALDPRHHLHHVVDVLGSERRDREPAVAADHGGDAVQRRRADRGSQSTCAS